MKRQNTLLAALALLSAPTLHAACALIAPQHLADALPGGNWVAVAGDTPGRCQFDNDRSQARLTLERQQYASASAATLAYRRSEQALALRLPSGGPAPHLGEAAYFGYRQERRLEMVSLARRDRQVVTVDYQGEGLADGALQAGLQGLTATLLQAAAPSPVSAGECEWLKPADVRRLFDRDAVLVSERASADLCEIHDEPTTAAVSLTIAVGAASPVSALRALHRQSVIQGCHFVSLQELGLQAHGVYRCGDPDEDKAIVRFAQGQRQIELRFTSSRRPDAATITALRILAKKIQKRL